MKLIGTLGKLTRVVLDTKRLSIHMRQWVIPKEPGEQFNSRLRALKSRVEAADSSNIEHGLNHQVSQSRPAQRFVPCFVVPISLSLSIQRYRIILPLICRQITLKVQVNTYSWLCHHPSFSRKKASKSPNLMILYLQRLPKLLKDRSVKLLSDEQRVFVIVPI